MTDAKGFDTYDDEINSGNRLIAIALVIMLLFCSLAFVSAQTNTLQTQGGVFNGGFEYGTGSVTGGNEGIIGDSNFNWYFNRGSSASVVLIDYNTSISNSGNQSIQIQFSSTTSGTRYMAVSNNPYVHASAFNPTLNSATVTKLIKVKPSTNYKVSGLGYLTTNTNSDTIVIVARGYKSDGTLGSYNATNFITNIDSWELMQSSFTTTNTDKYMSIIIYVQQTNPGSSYVTNGFVDDVRLEEVDSLSLTTQQSGRPSITITGVTDTNTIDQSQTTASSGTTLNNISYGVAQQFVPTQSKLTQQCWYLKKTNTPTGNAPVKVYTDNGSNLPSTTILAQTTLDVSTLTTDYAEYCFNTPAILTQGEKYWIALDLNNITDTSNTVSVGRLTGSFSTYYAFNTGTWSATGTTQQHYFKTKFAKLSSSVDVNVVAPDGTSELKSYDVNGGILTDANITINPNGTGRYLYYPKENGKNYLQDVDSMTGGALNSAEKLFFISSNNLQHSNGTLVLDTNLIQKFQAPIGCTFQDVILRAGIRYLDLYYSFNGTNYFSLGSADGTRLTILTDLNIDGNTSFYVIGDSRSPTSNASRSYGLTDTNPFYVDANLSCPTLTTPLFKNGTNTIYTMNKDTNWFSPAWTNTPITDSNFTEIAKVIASNHVYVPLQTLNITDTNKNVLTSALIQAKNSGGGTQGFRLTYYYTDGTTSYSDTETTASAAYVTLTFSTMSDSTKDLNYILLETDPFGVSSTTTTKDLNVTYSSINYGFKTTLTPSLMSNLTFDFDAPTTTAIATRVSDTNNLYTLTFTCTANSPQTCQDLNYTTNGTTWTNVSYTTPSTSEIKDINIQLLGAITLQYKSNDGNSNIETIKTLDINAPVLLTIKYPKNIATLVQLSEKWILRSTGAVTLNLTDLTTDYNVYVLPGTLTTFYIGDVNGNYTENTFTRTYYNDSNTGYDTLQPYLYAINTSLATTINVLNKNTLAPLKGYTIKFYGNLPGIGNTLIGQGTTDDKGQILQLFTASQAYVWEVHDPSNTLLGSFNYTAINNQAYVYYNFLSIYVSSITPVDLNSNTDINAITNQFFVLRNTFFDTCTAEQPCFPSALIAIIFTIIALITATSISGASGAFIGVKGLSVIGFCWFTIFFGIGFLPLFIYAFLGTITLLMAVLTQ